MKYCNDAEMGLLNLLQSEQVRDAVRQYCLDQIPYEQMMVKVCKEESRKKAYIPKIRKGPMMKNRRDNRNTQKAKMFKLTQWSFQQK